MVVNPKSKAIGDRIRACRKEQGLTLQDIAEEIGVTNGTLSRYEHGEFDKIKIPIIESIASILHVNPAWILGKTDDPVDYRDSAVVNDIPLALLHEWQDEGLSEIDIAKRYIAFRKAQEQDFIEEQQKDPSSEENGPSADALEFAMLYDQADPEVQQAIKSLLRAAGSSRAAQDVDPKAP